MEGRSYVRLNDTQTRLTARYKKGTRKGYHVGFKCLRNYYTVIKGHTTYITGIPTHGKTEFTWEILMNLTKFYQWKHAIFSSETGEPEDIAIEIVKKHQQAQFDPRFSKRMEESAAYESLNEMSEHFFIIDDPKNPDKDYTPEMILETTQEIIDAEGLDTLVIDPWNELKHDFTEQGGRQDSYLEYVLGMIRRFARKNKIHIFVIIHPRTLHRTKEGNYLPPSAFELSGGAPWYAKGDAILCCHRPLKLQDKTENTNMVNIIIQKAKPKEVGQKGSIELFYDVARGRYYEKDDTGLIVTYAREITAEEDQLTLDMEGVTDLPF